MLSKNHVQPSAMNPSPHKRVCVANRCPRRDDSRKRKLERCGKRNVSSSRRDNDCIDLRGNLVLIRQHERMVEELAVQLGFKDPITASGSVMTLPAAAADLRDWLADRRRFLPVQYDDWMQVIGDFRDSLSESGPKLVKVVDPITKQIESLLPNLMSQSEPDRIASPIAAFLRKIMPANVSDRISRPIDSLLQRLVAHNSAAEVSGPVAINEAVRADIRRHLARLEAELKTESAIVAAWRDLVSSAEKLKRPVEEVSFRRDTLFAIAEARNLDVVGSFGAFSNVSAVLTDSADAVQEELDRAAGVVHQRGLPTWEPSGVPTWKRLQLCEQVLMREAYRGDCIVWLRLAPTSLPQYEATHGQVTFYNASYLSAFIGHPELADRFQVPPMEVLTPPSPQEAPILREGEVEWEDNWNMAYARVLLPGIEIHTAEAKAKALVEGLKAVNHATKDTWRLLNGSILFIDGLRQSRFSWGSKEEIRDPYYPQNDWMGRDIGRMSRANQSLDSQSIHDLQDAIGMSNTLKVASGESPQATVMAAVRAIEHVNAWTTGGVKNWADFVTDYFKKAQSRVRTVEFISYFTRAAIESVPDRRPGARAQSELFEIRSQLEGFEWPHEVFHVRGAADYVGALKRIYADHDHWLVRGLSELEGILATPAGMHARLEAQGRRFDRQLRRLKRLRNSAIHGGPVSDTGCASVAVFANNLGHQCLNEAMRALLTDGDIPSHMSTFRADHIDRYQRVRTTGDIDALFVEAENDRDGDGDD